MKCFIIFPDILCHFNFFWIWCFKIYKKKNNKNCYLGKQRAEVYCLN